MTLTQKQNEVLKSVAEKLNVDSVWLYKLIDFESRWNPQAKSGIPYNLTQVKKYGVQARHARGLLQWIDETAKGLGFVSSEDLVLKLPTIEAQLEKAVLPYLSKYKPFPTAQSLYMAVFYPAARFWDTAKQFPAVVQAANPGIKTPLDYVRKVERRIAPAIGAGVVALIAASMFLFRKFI